MRHGTAASLESCAPCRYAAGETANAPARTPCAPATSARSSPYRPKRAALAVRIEPPLREAHGSLRFRAVANGRESSASRVVRYTIRGYTRLRTMPRAACTRVLTAIILAGATGLLAQSYVPQRVFDSGASQFSDFESMLAALVKADVAFVGEQHDDPNTHRLERALLEGLARRRGDIILSLEMFERDVQVRLDQFRAGTLPEAEFLASSRPWPRYATDYKPLVDLAIERQWPVLASNIPRPMASEISKAGIDVLASKSETEKAWFARQWQCPTDDEYYRRFKDVMSGHTGASDIDRFYAALCLKDETMAESIATAWSAAAATKPGTRPLVVHYNGSFHSDYGLGTAARVKRRLPDARTVVVTMIPVGNLDTVATTDHLRKGDYLVFTVK